MRIRNRIVFLLERGNESARGRRRIFRRKGHPNVGAFGSRGIRQNSLPAIATDEDRIESLPLRFLQNLETRRDTTGNENDAGFSSLEI